MSINLANLAFRDLTACEMSEQMILLSIRNEENVRRNMYTSHIIDVEEHKKWLDSLDHQKSNIYFAIKQSNEIIGCVCLLNWDRPNKRTSWGFYISSSIKGLGIGSAIEFKFLDFVFFEKDLLKINCEVISFNEPVIRLHKKFGFLEEGVRRSEIEREGSRYDVHLLGLTRSEWVIHRKNLIHLFDGVAYV